MPSLDKRGLVFEASLQNFNDIKWSEITANEDCWNVQPLPCYDTNDFPFLLAERASKDLIFILNS